jgi:rhodanese-related sulfurtransferase
MSPDGLEFSTEETARALADGSAQVVDVREPYERDAGYVGGTEHIEMTQLAGSAQALDAERPVIFVCRVGGRSLMAAQAFRRAGFDAYSMDGGITAWAQRGLPLEPEDGEVAPH